MEKKFGGEGGIRTPVTLSGKLDFEFCDTNDHSQLGAYIPINFKARTASRLGVFGPCCFQFADNSRTI